MLAGKSSRNRGFNRKITDTVNGPFSIAMFNYRMVVRTCAVKPRSFRVKKHVKTIVFPLDCPFNQHISCTIPAQNMIFPLFHLISPGHRGNEFGRWLCHRVATSEVDETTTKPYIPEIGPQSLTFEQSSISLCHSIIVLGYWLVKS